MSDTPQQPTPETDAALQSTHNTSAIYVFASFARTLERQRAEAVEALEKIIHFLDTPKGRVAAYDMREIAELALARIQAIGTKGAA